MSEEFISRQYPEELPFTDEERREFRKLLRDRPELKRSYRDFKDESSQELRSRLGRSPFLDGNLDKLFEIAAISGI